MRAWLGMLALFLLFACVPMIQAQDAIDPDAIWNAGAITIRNADGSRGQGYLVLEDDTVYVYTIEHVIDFRQRYVWVTIPSIVDEGRVTTDRFECESARRDNDNACRFALRPSMSRDIIDGEYDVLPYIRLDDTDFLQDGQVVGSPRIETSAWTMYSVYDYNSRMISIEALYYDDDEDMPMGHFCHGRSGGPLVVMGLDGDDLVIVLIDGHPISIGELQEGLDDPHPDYVDPSNTCYYEVGVNRPA